MEIIVTAITFCYYSILLPVFSVLQLHLNIKIPPNLMEKVGDKKRKNTVPIKIYPINPIKV